MHLRTCGPNVSMFALIPQVIDVEHNVQRDLSAQTVKEAESLFPADSMVPTELLENRQDLTQTFCFSIGDSLTQDVELVISVTQTGNMYEVGQRFITSTQRDNVYELVMAHQCHKDRQHVRARPRVYQFNTDRQHVQVSYGSSMSHRQAVCTGYVIGHQYYIDRQHTTQLKVNVCQIEGQYV